MQIDGWSDSNIPGHGAHRAAVWSRNPSSNPTQPHYQPGYDIQGLFARSNFLTLSKRQANVVRIFLLYTRKPNLNKCKTLLQYWHRLWFCIMRRKYPLYTISQTLHCTYFTWSTVELLVFIIVIFPPNQMGIPEAWELWFTVASMVGVRERQGWACPILQMHTFIDQSLTTWWHTPLPGTNRPYS
jgi:hypothetical protein